jgi:hypothetical protein
MAEETIEVGYRNIGQMAGVDYYHKFLIYTDRSGQQHTISGWTDDANTSDELPFGNIRVLANAPYDATNPDSALRHPGQRQFRETIVEGEDLSATWQKMVDNAISKDDLYPYDPLRQNSNTFADAVLREAGLREPRRDGAFFGHLAPGSGEELDTSVEPRSPDELGISNIGEAISLNGQQANPTEFQLALSPQGEQLLQNTEQHVRALAERHDIPWDQGMDNTVYALAAQAREQGMTGISYLNVVDGQIRFAQYDGQVIKEGQVDARVAANTEAGESLTQLASADQRALAQAQTLAEQKQYAEARAPEALSMSV